MCNKVMLNSLSYKIIYYDIIVIDMMSYVHMWLYTQMHTSSYIASYGPDYIYMAHIIIIYFSFSNIIWRTVNKSNLSRVHGTRKNCGG